jgi:hypothetical protein
MRCRYCNERLNLFKSLSGSSFCSKEHQKLYEEAEASKGLERLLEFVEKDAKPGKARPPAPLDAAPPTAKPGKHDAKARELGKLEPAQMIPVTAEKVIEPTDPVREPPIAGFRLERVAPTAESPSLPVTPNLEILESSFTQEPPAPPSMKFEIDVPAPPPEEPPLPLASWSNPAFPEIQVVADSTETPGVGSVGPVTVALEMPSLAAPDNCPPPALASWCSAPPLEIKTSNPFELPSVGSVRPRESTLKMLSPRPLPPASGAAIPRCSSEATGPRIAVPAVLDSRRFTNLARLNPLHRELLSATGKAKWLSVRASSPALPHLGVLELGAPPQVKVGAPAPAAIDVSGAMTRSGAGRGITPVAPAVPRSAKTDAPALSRSSALKLSALPQTNRGLAAIDMSGPMIRTGASKTISPPGALSQTARTLVTGAGANLILAGVQNAPGSELATLPALLEYQPRALHRTGAQPAAAGLPREAFATLKLDQSNRSEPIAMVGAMTRAGLSRALRQPQAPGSRLVTALNSRETLHRIAAAVRKIPDPQEFAISPHRSARQEFIAPGVDSTAPACVAGIDPVIVHKNFTIHESDTLLAIGITDVTKPPIVWRPLCLLDFAVRRQLLAIGINCEARRFLVEIQEKDASQPCAISPVRQPRQDCLCPVFVWPTKTRLRSGSASVGWFHESDGVEPSFQPGPPASGLFSLRFAPGSFNIDAAALAFDRTVRSLAVGVCEQVRRDQKAQGLARSQPLGTSPLSLVALPRPLLTRLGIRCIANFNQVSSIANPPKRGAAPRALAAESVTEQKLTTTLPPFTRSGVGFGFGISSYAEKKSRGADPVDLQNAPAASGPRPSPVRTQPASMLVLPPLSIPVGSSNRRPNVGWATVLSSKVSNARRPALALDLGAQTSPPEVLAANALPRRRGPTLPVVTAELEEFTIINR